MKKSGLISFTFLSLLLFSACSNQQNVIPTFPEQMPVQQLSVATKLVTLNFSLPLFSIDSHEATLSMRLSQDGINGAKDLTLICKRNSAGKFLLSSAVILYKSNSSANPRKEEFKTQGQYKILANELKNATLTDIKESDLLDKSIALLNGKQVAI